MKFLPQWRHWFLSCWKQIAGCPIYRIALTLNTKHKYLIICYSPFTVSANVRVTVGSSRHSLPTCRNTCYKNLPHVWLGVWPHENGRLHRYWAILRWFPRWTCGYTDSHVWCKSIYLTCKEMAMENASVGTAFCPHNPSLQAFLQVRTLCHMHINSYISLKYNRVGCTGGIAYKLCFPNS